MYYFNQVSLIGLISNIIFVPLIGFIVVPGGLLAAAILPLSPLFAEAILHLAAGILEWSLKIVDTLSPLPLAAARTITPSIFEIACYGLLMWAIVQIVVKYRTVLISGPENKESSVNGILARIPGIQICKPMCFFLAFVLALITADVSYWVYQRYWRSDLRVTVLDVGQGSAALLQLPGGVWLAKQVGHRKRNKTQKRSEVMSCCRAPRRHMATNLR
jgi:competence protein ComEC